MSVCLQFDLVTRGLPVSNLYRGSCTIKTDEKLVAKAMSKLYELDQKQLRSFRKIVVFGDLHGDYAAFESGSSLVDPSKDGVIFLGDYADRGPSGVEVIDAVYALMKEHAGNVLH